MGAMDFVHVVAVPNVDAERIAMAVEQAAYDYGHAGYTGTIAEKNDYVIVSGKLPLDEAEALADEMISDDDHRITDKWGPAGAIPLQRVASCSLAGPRPNN